jgi:hypothetical protein
MVENGYTIFKDSYKAIESEKKFPPFLLSLYNSLFLGSAYGFDYNT